MIMDQNQLAKCYCCIINSDLHYKLMNLLYSKLYMKGFDWATLLGQCWLSFVVESVHDHLRVL